MIKMEVNLKVKSVESNRTHDRIMFEPCLDNCEDDDHVDLREGYLSELSIISPMMLGQVRPGMRFKAEYTEVEEVPVG